MARALYPHELSDPDFSWLISSFAEWHPDYVLCEVAQLPVVFIKAPKVVAAAAPSTETDPTDLIGDDSSEGR